MKRLLFTVLLLWYALGASAQSGIIYTIAGNDTFGCTGDGGPATKAQIGNPNGIAINSSEKRIMTSCFFIFNV